MRALLVVLSLTLAACGNMMPAATMTNVPGKYDGIYGNKSEHVDIRTDGTYYQSVTVDGKEYKNSGTWRIKRAPSDFDFIYFKNFAISYDTAKHAMVAPQPLVEYAGMWVSGRGGERIVFEDEPEYAIVKAR
jgi:hypothetical protein